MLLVLQKNLRCLILQQGYTQQQFATETGLTKKTINRVMSGDIEKVKLNTIILISQKLNVDFPCLFSRNISEIDEFKKYNFLDLFIENTNRYLKKRRKSRKSLSQLPGISASTVSDILNRKTKNPLLYSFMCIANSLDVDLEILFLKNGGDLK